MSCKWFLAYTRLLIPNTSRWCGQEQFYIITISFLTSGAFLLETSAPSCPGTWTWMPNISKNMEKSCLVGKSWCYGRYFTETSPAKANAAGMRIEYGAPTTEHNTPQDQPPNLFTARLIYLGFLPWHWPLDSYIGWAPSGYRPCRSAPKSKHDLHRSYRCLKRRSAACCLGSRSKSPAEVLSIANPHQVHDQDPLLALFKLFLARQKCPFSQARLFPLSVKEPKTKAPMDMKMPRSTIDQHSEGRKH